MNWEDDDWLTGESVLPRAAWCRAAAARRQKREKRGEEKSAESESAPTDVGFPNQERRFGNGLRRAAPRTP